MDIIYNTCEKAVKGLAANGIEKYIVRVAKREKSEFNLDGDAFSLFRTTFDNSLAITAYDGNRKGSAVGNDFSDAGIDTAVRSAVASAASAEDDPANGIAPGEGKKCFEMGVLERDMDRFFDRVMEFKNDLAAKYPLIKLTSVVASYSRSDSLFKTSEGSEFESHAGAYDFVAEFAGNDGERTTGLNYCTVETKDLDEPFIVKPAVKLSLDEAVAQLNQVELKGKFDGTVVFTPGCTLNMLYMLYNNYISDSVILTGVSLWKDKLGQKVTDERISVISDPFDERIVRPGRYTPDGFLGETTSLIENGVLKNFDISLYTANKTGFKPSKITGGFIVKPGDKTLDEIIASIKKGLVVGGFSGGQPGANGEFSGVAKNSFLIEDGRIVGAVSETMINGNLAGMLNELNAVSKEVICNGENVSPYIAVNGITISGK